VQSNSPVVLIVDDHEDSLAMYSFGLLAMGFQPLTAETAEDAFLRACQFHPDVVVADVTLPGSSGLDLTRRLREDARTRDAGIIVLTGHAGASVKQQADDAGCDRFVLKPCLPDALACEIRDVLTERHDGTGEAHSR
jgi:two-component system, cell cycle response regulator DivK